MDILDWPTYKTQLPPSKHGQVHAAAVQDALWRMSALMSSWSKKENSAQASGEVGQSKRQGLHGMPLVGVYRGKRHWEGVAAAHLWRA